ncbi:MAG: hypothetical protein EOO70_09290 [Myxococcaceae bacterium]|nr:MAG: hypothetical protein EOO70_09290 [Myxococcaceae bacterium]
MFIAWKVRKLSDTPRRREGDHCPHDPSPSNRVTLIPMLSVNERGPDGKPRRRVLHRFCASIRPCCIADDYVPLARLYFWANVDNAILNAPDHVADRWDEVEAMLAERVPKPTPMEQDIWALYMRLPEMDLRGLTDHERARIDWSRARVEYDFTKKYEEAKRQAHNSPPFSGFDPFAVPQCFAKLGLTWPCTDSDIRRAQRQRIRDIHPDNGTTGDEAASKDVNRWASDALAYWSMRQTAEAVA